VVCSDYRKGVLTPRVLREITVMRESKGLGLITAPKDTKGGEVYRGDRADAEPARIRRGWRASEWDRRGDVADRAAERLLGEHDFAALLVTRGREGMTLFEQTAEGVRRGTSLGEREACTT